MALPPAHVLQPGMQILSYLQLQSSMHAWTLCVESLPEQLDRLMLTGKVSIKKNLKTGWMKDRIETSLTITIHTGPKVSAYITTYKAAICAVKNRLEI